MLNKELSVTQSELEVIAESNSNDSSHEQDNGRPELITAHLLKSLETLLGEIEDFSVNLEIRSEQIVTLIQNIKTASQAIHLNNSGSNGMNGSSQSKGFSNGSKGILTEREIEVLHLVALGLTNGEISEELALSVHTIERHLSNIFTKIDAKNRVNAVAYAFANCLFIDFPS